MDFTLESKACVACAKAKRRCGKQIPTCGRCASRGLSCDYPARVAKACTSPYAQPQRQQQLQPSPEMSTAPIAAILTPTPTPTITDILFDIPGTSMALDDLYPFHFENAAALPISSCSIDVNPKSISMPWYLNSPSWELEHHAPTDIPPNYSSSTLLDHVETIKDWQRRWVQTGSNPYIHTNVYRFRMPRCVQDAYTTLSAYIERTPENKSVIARIVEDRVRQLLDDQPDGIEGDQEETHGALGPFENLARVHALHIYQSIGLFDGDIRLRHVAETQIPTLNAWLRQLLHSTKAAAAQGLRSFVMPLLVPLEVGKRPSAAAAAAAAAATPCIGSLATIPDAYMDVGNPVFTPSGHHQDSRSSKNNTITPRLSQEESEWYGWCFSETIRRTWMVVAALQTIYLTLQIRIAPCPGRSLFTSWEGQWDAKTAFAWASKCSESGGGSHQSVDFASCTGWIGKDMFESRRPEDVDEFTMELLGITYGWERVDKWRHSSMGANGQRRF